MFLKPKVTLFAAILALSGGAVGNTDELDEIANYRDYSEVLSSSGQPSESQLRALKDAGFERIVFLAFSDSHGSIANEDSQVEKLGMEFVHVPVDWEAPSKADFYLFAGAIERELHKKTLIHCQVNFRASAFSFLYRVLYNDVDMGDAKKDLDSVWVPNETWRNFIFSILEENGRSPHCDTCLWNAD